MHCQLRHKRQTEAMQPNERMGQSQQPTNTLLNPIKAYLEDRKRRRRKKKFMKKQKAENRRTIAIKMFWVCHADDSTQKRIITFKTK